MNNVSQDWKIIWEALAWKPRMDSGDTVQRQLRKTFS